MAKARRTSGSAAGGESAALFSVGNGIDLRPYKTVRIAVSGDVRLNKLETDIVDTAEFQRLRGIKELGTTYLVYPTALHTRFDHSLGTLSMAVEMMRAVRENEHSSEGERKISPEQEQLARAFALVHDICHIPFGHTLEDESCIFPRHDDDVDRTEYFLGRGSTIGKILLTYLGSELYDRLMAVYKADKTEVEALGEDSFIYDIVNNTVCADLLDYLRRDSYFCNIVLDMDYRFLKYLYLHRVNDTRRLAVRLWKEEHPSPRRDILSELTRLLDNRYLLGERVYFHHAKLVAGGMLASAVQRGLQAGKVTKSSLYDIGAKPSERAVSDESLLDRLASCGVGEVEKLARCIKERVLWKTIHEHPRSTVTAEQERLRNQPVWKSIMDTWWRDPGRRVQDEDLLAALTGVEPADLVIHCPDEEMAMKLADMKVFWNGELQPLRECADDPIVGPKLKVILDSHKNLWAIRVFMNQTTLARKGIAAGAAQYMFTYDPDVKERHTRSVFREAAAEVAKSEGVVEGMLASEYEKRLDEAVNRLASQTDQIRDRAALSVIVRDAFAQ